MSVDYPVMHPDKIEEYADENTIGNPACFSQIATRLMRHKHHIAALYRSECSICSVKLSTSKFCACKAAMFELDCIIGYAKSSSCTLGLCNPCLCPTAYLVDANGYIVLHMHYIQTIFTKIVIICMTITTISRLGPGHMQHKSCCSRLPYSAYTAFSARKHAASIWLS